MQRTWLAWSEKQNFRSEDQLAFAPFNRLTWYATTGWKKPYPGDSKVMTPAEVLKRFPQTGPTGDDNAISKAPARTGRIVSSGPAVEARDLARASRRRRPWPGSTFGSRPGPRNGRAQRRREDDPDHHAPRPRTAGRG